MSPDELVPIDAGPRDRIRLALEESLFVDAGAGSGKTTALVGRIVELVRHGLPIAKVAAITFTEAAAAELRHRLRRSLRDAAEGATDLFEQGVFLAALDGLDGAAIQTLHAFAQRILRQFPVEAGLPPSIEVADEIASIVRFAARWRPFLDEWEADPAWRPVLRRFLLVGGKLDHLSDLARVFNDHWDRLDRPDATVVPGPLTPVVLDAVMEPLAAALDLADRCAAAEDGLLRHLLDTIGPVLGALAAAGDDDQRIQLLMGVPKLSKGNSGNKDDWCGFKPEVKGLLESAQAEREALVGRVTSEVVAALQQRLARFVVESADARRRSGLLEFHDLLVLARDVLRYHAEVRGALAESYQALLLDEFQDTDPIQLELARLIAGGIDGDITPGRLFFVGDPKQSIYRFRRADLTAYLDTRAQFTAGLCELSSNFRTVPGVIDWVNGVFEHLMVGDGQAPYLGLTPTRAPLDDDRPPVVVAGGAVDAMAAEVRRQSAVDLAAIVSQLLEEGWGVQNDSDDGAGPLRAVRHDDICVLVPSRLAVPALEDAFGRAGLPYRLMTSSLVWASQEVREVLAVLRAVDDPGDEVALIAALRSPIFACADSDLLAWVGAGGRWSYLFTDRPALPEDHPVAAAFATLAGLHQERWWLGPDGLVDRLLSEHGVLELAAVAGRRRDRWRRLRFLADQAQAFVESQHGDLASFLDWIELQSSDVVRVSSPILPEDDDPAIRVMTIHGAKGLEFPVVALFGLGVSTQSRPSSVLWSGDDPEVRLAKDLASAGYNDILTAEEQMDRAERVRLLYVGATRARDRLIVCTHHKATVKEPKNPSLGALFERAIEEIDPALVVRWDPDGRPPLSGSDDVAPALPLDLPPPDSAEVAAARQARAQYLADHGALVAASARRVWSATAVARAAHPDALDTDVPPDDPPTADGDSPGVTWRRGRAGTAIGRAVHGTLQLVDFEHLDRLDSIARAQATAEGVDAYVDAVAGLARAGATSALITELAARRHWREMYVAAPIEGVTVEGYVDLLAEDGAGGLIVVDYKTDSVRGPADVAERTERYRLQAATYALALEAVTGLPVSRAVFLFLGREGALPSEVSDLDAAKTEARAVLAGESLAGASLAAAPSGATE